MADTKTLISIDFWNTLVKGASGGESRREARLRALRGVASNYMKNLSGREVEEASRQTSDEFHRVWFNQQRTPSTGELVRNVVDRLGIPATEQEIGDLAKLYEDSFWEAPPELVEGVEELLPELAARYRLALISDTMYSPGRVLRKFLENRNMARYFNGYVFSDETGFSKPHPEAYTMVLEETGCHPERSWHIGDLMKTDIKGAKAVGMKAILFTGVTGREGIDEPADAEPDHICGSWMEIGELLLD